MQSESPITILTKRKQGIDPMAYKVKEFDGMFYVGKGAKYWPNTESETFEQAEREAIHMEMVDLYNKACEMYQKGVDKGYFDEPMGEYLC